jgi:hypothetical protein
MLPDGRILCAGGVDGCDTCYVHLPEIYNPSTNSWTAMVASATNPNTPNYPFLFVLPDGRVAQAGASETPLPTQVLNVSTQTWSMVDSNVVDGGSAVMYAPGKILKAGTSSNQNSPGSAAATTYVIDFNEAQPHWTQTQSMAFPRSFLNLTALPDGTVLATGGGTDRTGINIDFGVLEAELWNPVTETWATMAAMENSRLYHSIAILMPDGRVLVAGSGYSAGPDQLNGEYFSPPYLFKGPRPAVTSAPGAIQWGSNFFVGTPDAQSIASVAFIKTGAVTHSFNQEQRFMNLPFAAAPGGLTVDAPLNANLATPGWYLLFLVNGNGVPSIGQFIKLPAGSETQPPTIALTAPSNGATVSGSTLVSATASDNTGVVGVQFLLDGANVGAEDIAVPYEMTWNTIAALNGSHTLSAQARDAAGNVGSAVPITVTVSNVVGSNLSAAYGINEGAGPTIGDASANGNTGTLTGATWLASGKYGAALSFNGTTNYVTINDSTSLDVTGPGTVEAWIRLTSLNRWHGVVAKGTVTSDPAHCFAVEVTPSNTVQCGIGNGSAANLVYSAATIPSATWTHVAFTWDGSFIRVYVNGVLSGTAAQTITPFNNTAPVYLGQYGGNADRMAGAIDEVRIYKNALSQLAIQSDMNSPITP